MVTSDGGKQAAANFARNIKARREAAGISQEHVAEQMTARGFGFTQATVWKIESGQRGVPLAEAIALAEILAADAAPVSVESLVRAPDVDRARQALEATGTELAAAARAIEDAVAAYGRVVDEYTAAYAVAIERTQPGERAGAIWEWIDPIAPELVALAARLSADRSDDQALDAVELLRQNIEGHRWAWHVESPRREG